MFWPSGVLFIPLSNNSFLQQNLSVKSKNISKFFSKWECFVMAGHYEKWVPAALDSTVDAGPVPGPPVCPEHSAVCRVDGLATGGTGSTTAPLTLPNHPDKLCSTENVQSLQLTESVLRVCFVTGRVSHLVLRVWPLSANWRPSCPPAPTSPRQSPQQYYAKLKV